ncbi:MAG TPA: hypothetical protein PLD25_19640 [Chloroflexota bacterium]|nr:hypothetical protein [Chloroflexota bacterium]HUM71201.1 hypothetical protein [Chloroflexota bacterium]
MCTLLVVINLLLGDVVENLLSHLPMVQVQRMKHTNFAGLLQGMDQMQPDVVVLETNVIGDSLHALLSRLLHNGRVRVILVNSDQNLVHVYDKFSISLTQSADLVNLIEEFAAHSVAEKMCPNETV